MPLPRILQKLFANNGAGPKLLGSIIPFGATLPKAHGTASAGSVDEAARADHVHPKQADMTGATTTKAGASGLVPAPAAGAANRYFRSDGSWQVPPDTNTTYSAASQTVAGLMSAADKKKLDGIDPGATATAAPPAAATESPKAAGTAAVGASAKYAREDHVHPSDNTDTHWTTRLLVGAATAYANAATANGATYLKAFDNTVLRDQHLIKGSGSVTVTSDANGHIIINGTDTNTTYSGATQAASGLMSANDKKKLDGIEAATTQPRSAGTAAVGVSNKYAREDHVHPAGNASSNAQLIVGSASGTANAATTNGHTCLTLMDGDTVRNRHMMIGQGSTEVFSNADGTIVVKDTNMTGASASAAGTAGNVPAPAAGVTHRFLRADASWGIVRDVPLGGIIMFSGTFDGGKYPINPSTGQRVANWAICDGSTYNGIESPNLVDKFVRGCKAADVGKTGGSDTHTHASGKLSVSGSVDGTTLETKHLAAHSHTVSPQLASKQETALINSDHTSPTVYNAGLSANTGSVGGDVAHTHKLSGASLSGSTDSGSSLPAYYSLAFIIRIA